jgi:metallophosphoesterase superfamily enzyme
VAGDIKHPIVGTPGPLRPVLFEFFSSLLIDRLGVEIVLGNHDVGLVAHLPKEVVVHGPTGVVRHGVGIFHGHCWPSAAVRAQRTLVAGHLHPGFRFAPTATSTEPKQRCWVRTTFPSPELRRGAKRTRHRPFEAREMIVLPAFHPLAGTESLNRTRPSRGRSFLFSRFLALGSSRLYLLDGTDLGPLKIPAPNRRKQGRSRSRPGR